MFDDFDDGRRDEYGVEGEDGKEEDYGEDLLEDGAPGVGVDFGVGAGFWWAIRFGHYWWFLGCLVPFL